MSNTVNKFVTPHSSTIDGESIEELLLLVGDADKGCRRAALDRLMAMDLAGIYADLDRAVRDGERADLRNGAMEVLVGFGSRSLLHLFKLLRDDDEEVRNFSTVMLGDIGSREAVGPLIKTLRDPDANVRHGAAEALARIGDRAALGPLLELLKEDFWQQCPAIAAIGEMRDSRAVPHLLELLDNELLTDLIIGALGRIGDPRGLLPLGTLLAASDGRFAGAAARAIVGIQKSLDDSFTSKNSLSGYGQTVSLRSIITQQGIANLNNLLQLDGDKETVLAAITLLGWLGELSALPVFFQLAEREDFHDALENAILAIGKPALATLLESFEQGDDNVKIVVARSLRWLGGEQELKLLQPLLLSKNEAVQAEVLASLKGMTDPRILPRLFELLENGGEAIASGVIELLGNYPYQRMHDSLVRLLAAPAANSRRRGACLLGRITGEIPQSQLLPLFRDAAASVRKEAVRAAGRCRDEKLIPLLREALLDADGEVQEEAVMALAEFAGAAPLKDIVQLLGHSGAPLDFAVIRAIGSSGSQDAAVLLVTYLQKGGIGRHLEYAAIEALGKLGDASAAEFLAGYLRHPDPDIRRLSVQALGALVGFDPLPAMEKACSDPHWSVRIAAMQVLGKVGDTRGEPALLAALKDSDTMVRKNAILALGDLHDSAAVPALVQQLTDLELGNCAFEALLKIGRQGLPRLHRFIKGNAANDVKERVIDLIGKIGQQKSVDPLLALLHDASPAIRLAAIDALVYCFDSVLLKELAQLRKGDLSGEVRARAELALRTLTMEKFF